MVVQHNLTAMNANRYLGINNSKLSKSLEKLSSGYAINRAGDNAAGLAVSEKMRSQIAGMTQGVKNAQDGISMVQTFEGALTETHSILQRMKTLADQMGNGTYDDPVDRTAAQQEFLQLNDELDQIADTDFNGVVVLNGGKMADGAVADKNGLIDYANQPPRAAAQWGNKDVNTIDSKSYNGAKVAADSLWDNLGLKKDVESVDITFKYDKESDTWAAVDADDATALKNIANIAVIRGGAGGTDIADNGITAAGNNGGFSVVSTGTAANTGDAQLGAAAPAAYADDAGVEYANVVLDSTKLVNGDTVTIRFTRPEIPNTAPENAAVVENSIQQELTPGAANDLDKPKIVVNKLGVVGQYETTNKAAADKAMTAEAAAAFNNFDGAKFEVTYKNNAATTGAVESVKITLADGSEKTFAKNANKDGFTAEDGTKYAVTVKDGKMTIADNSEVELFEITLDNTLTGTGMGATATSKYSFEMAVDTAVYEPASEPKATIVDPADDYSVSKSNAFNNSEAQLTYKDSITLQVGARTKDAVNFTFKYASTAIGDLKDDLNVTAAGLGTDKLNISTQDAANYAVDKIDQAINKVSLIRGTFGAIQNRLEHKIDNMNVSIENLTSAESQIRDTNMPQEMMNFTKQQILAQASQSMLAQANQLPQGVLSLLQ